MRRYRSEIIISLLLILSTIAVYWQVKYHDFINFDDPGYVTANQNVKAGLTKESIKWALTTKFRHHWHPLTWISHMTDCEIFGLNPGWHHATSLLLHLANTVLLFLIFNRATGEIWPSALVAALFALHPLHVETVAWVADRKDVLYTFFWMLAMGSYVFYCERPGFLRYLLVFQFFVLSLMSKSMAVTLPVVFLLMDFWPLQRFQLVKKSSGRNPQNQTFSYAKFQKMSAYRLVGEKVLFFILMAVAGAVIFFAMYSDRSFKLSEIGTQSIFIAEALLFYVNYIWKTIWPSRLAVIYPYPNMIQPVQVLGAALLLILISILVIRWSCKKPYFLTGWFWYLLTLLPVIGIVTGGPHGMSDRYTYVPLIGIFIIVAWGAPDVMARWRYRRGALTLVAGALLSVLMLLTYRQVSHWENSITLFKHTVKVTENNYRAHNNLGTALKRNGRLDEAISHFSEAIRINPSHLKSRNNMGNVLKRQGRIKRPFDIIRLH
jgi:hypothetical protein